jgi:hypothetical protein
MPPTPSLLTYQNDTPVAKWEMAYRLHRLWATAPTSPDPTYKNRANPVRKYYYGGWSHTHTPTKICDCELHKASRRNSRTLSSDTTAVYKNGTVYTGNRKSHLGVELSASGFTVWCLYRNSMTERHTRLTKIANKNVFCIRGTYWLLVNSVYP